MQSFMLIMNKHESLDIDTKQFLILFSYHGVIIL